jgi:GntR family transcriptional regulator
LGKHATQIEDATRTPRYVQVYTILRNWIVQGVYPAGSRLPSESELGETFGVSRITTRSAIDMLTKEGLVRRAQGRGTFVGAGAVDVPASGDMTGLVRRLEKLKDRTRIAQVTIETRGADEQQARDLGLDPGEPGIYASFVRMEKKTPIGFTEIFVPADLGVTLTAADLELPTPTILESKGFQILGAHQLIGAALADQRIASVLQIPVGAPIVRVRLLVVDLAQRAIEHLAAHYRADHYEHHVFLRRRGGGD